MKKVKQILRTFVSSCCTLDVIKEKLPIIKWLPKYTLTDLQSDVISGLTVALTLLPQGLAYASIANLPQQYGLYSAFMGLFVYFFLGTSKDVTVGPTAIQSLLTAAFCSTPEEAVVLCLLSGIVQMVMGIVHLGILVNFISYPVINGFSSAAAITIALSQLKSLLGLTGKIPQQFVDMVYTIGKKIPETRKWDLTMSILCLFFLILLKFVREYKFKPNPNGEPLTTRQRVWRKLVWLTGIAANAIIVILSTVVLGIMHHYGLTTQITITGYVNPGLPPFTVPPFTYEKSNTTVTFTDTLGNLGAGIIIVPIIGLVESIAIAKVFARQNNYRINPTQELLAIGASNIISSFFSSYPITGAFSRTAVNSQSGVRTPMGGIVTGGIVLLALQFLTPLFKFIPKAALAAVIVMAVIPMVDYMIIVTFWKIQKIALIPWAATFFCSFFVGIQYGILIGVGIQIVIMLYPIARPMITFSRKYSERKEFPLQEDSPKVEFLDYVVVTFNQAIRFPSVEYLQSKVLKYVYKDGEAPRSVIMDCSHLAMGLDYTTVVGLVELVADFKKKNVFFAMACVLPTIQDEMNNAGMKDCIYGDSVDDAIMKIKEKEKAGELNDVLTSVTVENGKIVGATAMNGVPLPKAGVEVLNLGFEDTDDDENIRVVRL